MHSVPCCHLIDYFSCSKWVSIHVCPSLLPETLILSSWLKKFVPIYSSCDFLLDEKMSLVSSLWLILPVLVHHMHRIIQLSSFQSLSCVWLCDLMHCSTPGFYVLHHLPELAQTHVPWVSDAIWPCHSLLSPSLLTSTFPSIRVFSKDLAVTYLGKASLSAHSKARQKMRAWLTVPAGSGLCDDGTDGAA